MLGIILSLITLIYSLSYVVDSNLPFLSGFFGSVLIFIITFAILFLIFLFVVKTTHWIDIICKASDPVKNITLREAFRNGMILKYVKTVTTFGIFLIVANFLWQEFFQKTYLCKEEDDQIYFLVLDFNGSIFVYDNNKRVVSSTKYHNVGKDRFIGENGWEGWPGTENNSMAVQYRDKNGILKSFYKGCFLKRSYF
ncbi:MAG: hypothetical protein CK430_15265 [Legionella sp.]|nr:MAG: hypothetical protein CK430_15265 [Legionella sp.]